MVHNVLHTHHSQKISFEIQDGGSTAKIKGINKNHSIHHFLSTILLQELAKAE